MFVLWRRGFVGLGALLAVAPLSGCGPVISSYLILSAQAELDGAEAAEAEKYAPYEYAAAGEYLHKAREEQGYAHFQPAIEYAFKAQDLAERGRIEAKKRKEKETPPTQTPDTPTTEPATDGPPPDTTGTGQPASGNPNVIIKKKPGDAPATPPGGAAEGNPSIKIKKVPPKDTTAPPPTEPTPAEPAPSGPTPPEPVPNANAPKPAVPNAKPEPAPEVPPPAQKKIIVPKPKDPPPSGPTQPAPRPEGGGAS